MTATKRSTPAGEEGESRSRRAAARLGETPLQAVARRRGADGAPFLRDVEVAAGERLASDFERGAAGGAATQNWARFLACVDEGPRAGGGASRGGDARARAEAALAALGPGLGDVALRVCCHEMGLERVERALGWPSRSGKIVLKIALDRLARHYGLEARGRTSSRGIEVWRDG